MAEGFSGTLKEVGWSISPIVIIALAIQIFLLQRPAEEVASFLVSVGMVLLGFSLFLVGVKEGMLPIGEAVGSALPRKGSIFFVVAVVFTLSFIVTLAEPDVRILSSIISSVSENAISRDVLLFVISFSLAFFIAVAVLRILFSIQMRYVLGLSYLAVMALSLFVPEEFTAIAFDSGGVTTGPMTVPVILALGIGLTSVLSGKSQLSEGFGLIGIASIGPILGLMIMGVLSG
jgi:hypothetical protein